METRSFNLRNSLRTMTISSCWLSSFPTFGLMPRSPYKYFQANTINKKPKLEHFGIEDNQHDDNGRGIPPELSFPFFIHFILNLYESRRVN